VQKRDQRGRAAQPNQSECGEGERGRPRLRDLSLSDREHRDDKGHLLQTRLPRAVSEQVVLEAEGRLWVI